MTASSRLVNINRILGLFWLLSLFVFRAGAQDRDQLAISRKGRSCAIPPKTVGYFYPIPFGEEGWVVEVSADGQWLSLRTHSPDSNPPLLSHVDGKTAFSGFQRLSDLQSADPVRLDELEDEEGNFVAQLIKRLPRPPMTLQGIVTRITRGPQGQVVTVSIGHTVCDSPAALVTSETVWQDVTRPDVLITPGALLVGHRVLVTSLTDRWQDWNDGTELIPVAQSIEITDINEIHLVQDSVRAFNSSTGYISLESFPEPVFINQSQLEVIKDETSAGRVFVDVEAKRQNDGKWRAESVSFPKILDFCSGSSSMPSFAGVFMWEWQKNPSKIWPSMTIPANAATQRLSFSYRRERKYHPFFWWLTAGILYAPHRDIIDVELDKGKDTEEFCEFEIGRGRLQTSLNAIERKGFSPIR